MEARNSQKIPLEIGGYSYCIYHLEDRDSMRITLYAKHQLYAMAIRLPLGNHSTIL